ncbi:MAG: tautomerase family protein [Chloroflexi bacterium]|nr:tautomerase family protein [Chloroflexota bacterium]
MPTVTVETIEGRTIDQKRGLVKDITQAVTKHFSVEPDTVFIYIYDIQRENWARGGKLYIDSYKNYDRGRTNWPRVVVSALKGRTIEQKKALVGDITTAVAKHFNVDPQSVTVSIRETSRDGGVRII